MLRDYLCHCAAALTILVVNVTSSTAQQPLPAEGDEDQLVAVLKSDAAMFEKAKACQRLAIIGTAKSVPALAKLLSDEKMTHYARYGLESNPAGEVDEAFREALGQLRGKALIGVINSIGVRRDGGATNALVGLSGNDNQEVAAAALAALGAIATPEAVAAVQDALQGNDDLRVDAADACLTAADVLLREGNNAAAADIFAAVRAADLPKQINVASRFGEIRADAGKLADLMKEYLSHADNDLFRIGLFLAHDLSGEEVTGQLVAHLESLPDDRKALLISVLGSRGDTAALPSVIQQSSSDDATIKLAAIRVLGTLGDQSVVTALLEAAAASDESLAEAARDSLAQLSADGVDEVLLAKITGSEGKMRVVLVEAVGRRGISEAIPTLLNVMNAQDDALQTAAVDALAMTVGPKELPQMLDLMLGSQSQDEPLVDALRKACQRMPDRDAAATLLMDRMKSAQPEAKAALLDLLIYVGGEKALEGLGTIAKGDDDALADAATQALGKWLTPDVAPVLLDLAQNGNPKYRIRCLRGYIRVIRQFGLRSGQRLQMSKTAFKTATRDDERKLVLDTVTRFPSGAGLRFVLPHLKTASLSEDACKAAVVIGEKIVNTDSKTAAAGMQQVLKVVSDPDLESRAKVVLQQAGE